jgi:hypothetical protein
MITLKLTTFNGNTKSMTFNTPSDVRMYITALSNSLPKSVVLQVSCDTLGISGHLKGNK